MLQREHGATISEIMSTMGWQKHTVRGFMAGAMKKAGYTVESFKPEGGERLPDQQIDSLRPKRPPGSGRGGLFAFLGYSRRGWKYLGSRTASPARGPTVAQRRLLRAASEFRSKEL